MSMNSEPDETTTLLRRNSSRSVHGGEMSDRKRWWSIRVMYGTMFLSSVTFTLTISSIWPFLRVLDHTATTDLLGWVVSSYSLGQLVASPLFGMWANWRGKSREPLVASITLGIGANLMYAYLESIPGNKAVMMIVARGLVGFGAGNVAVVRSYVAGATTLKERTGAMANVSIFQSVGFILGPVIQATFVPMSYPGLVNTRGMHLNMYTAPAFLGAILCVVNVILLFAVFREFRVPDEISVVNIQSSYEESVQKYKPDYLAVISCITIFFVVLFIFTVFETIATPLSMDMFAWTKSKSTLLIGVILASCGVEAIFVFVALKILSRRFNERVLLIGGFVLCFIGYFVQLPWGDGKLVIAPAVDVASSNLTSFDDVGIFDERVFSVSIFDGWFDWTITKDLEYIDTSSLESTLSNVINVTVQNFTDLTMEPASTLTTAITDLTMDPASTLTTAITDQSIVPRVTTLATAITDLTLKTQSTSIITQISLSSAKTLSTSTVTTTITPAIISTAETLTTCTPTITPAMLSTAETFTTTLTSTSTSTSTITSALTSEITSSASSPLTTEEILSTLSTTIYNGTTTSWNNRTTTVEPVGCPAELDWCYTSPPIYLAQFLIGCIIISAGYPTANVMSYTLFSKILGPKPQGLWMGWLTASGSLARTLGPIFVSQIYNSFGPRVTYAVDCGLILLTIAFIAVMYRKLVPCKYSMDYPTPNGSATSP